MSLNVLRYSSKANMNNVHVLANVLKVYYYGGDAPLITQVDMGAHAMSSCTAHSLSHSYIALTMVHSH